jgi:hypothetical protein
VSYGEEADRIDEGELMRVGKARETRKSLVLKRVLVSLGILLSITVFVSCGSERTNEPTPKSNIPSSLSQGAATQSETLNKVETSAAPSGGAPPHAGAGTGAGLAGPTEVTAIHIKSMDFSPERPVAGDSIKLKVVFEESVSFEVPLRYRWKVNAENVQESESNTLTFQTKRGDLIEVLVFAGNSREETRARRANVTVDNAPPVVKKVGEHLSPNGEYLTQLEATDPDGDVVTVKLQRGPTGMTLDEGRKELRWSVPEGTTGSFPVEVLASDPSGATVVLSYELTIRQVQPSAGSAANATTVSSPSR